MGAGGGGSASLPDSRAAPTPASGSVKETLRFSEEFMSAAFSAHRLARRRRDETQARRERDWRAVLFLEMVGRKPLPPLQCFISLFQFPAFIYRLFFLCVNPTQNSFREPRPTKVAHATWRPPANHVTVDSGAGKPFFSSQENGECGCCVVSFQGAGPVELRRRRALLRSEPPLAPPTRRACRIESCVR